jgi:hypothetical protein
VRSLSAASSLVWHELPLIGPVVLVIYREDHRFLLDPIIPKPGGTPANYDLVIASQPYRARSSLEFKAKRVIGPLARAPGPGGRLIAIQSHGHDPGMEIIRKIWPDDNPFIHDFVGAPPINCAAFRAAPCVATAPALRRRRKATRRCS